MNRDELEFAISQYLDGTLPPEQRTAVEDTLRADPQAAAILAEYQKLDDFIGAAAGTEPRVRWDRFAEGIGQAIDDHCSRPILTIGRVSWALAASVLIAVGVLAVRMNHNNHEVSVGRDTLVAVVGPQAETAAGAQEIDVSVGQPAEADADYAADSLLTRRSAVALEGFTSPDAGPIQ